MNHKIWLEYNLRIARKFIFNQIDLAVNLSLSKLFDMCICVCVCENKFVRNKIYFICYIVFERENCHMVISEVVYFPINRKIKDKLTMMNYLKNK